MAFALLSEACVRSLHHGEDMVRGKCLFSGLIIQCFFNGLLLVGLGTHDEYAAEAEQDYHVSTPLQGGHESRLGCRGSWGMLWLGCGVCHWRRSGQTFPKASAAMGFS